MGIRHIFRRGGDRCPLLMYNSRKSNQSTYIFPSVFIPRIYIYYSTAETSCLNPFNFEYRTTLSNFFFNMTFRLYFYVKAKRFLMECTSTYLYLSISKILKKLPFRGSEFKGSMNYKKIFKKLALTLRVEDERFRLVFCISIVFDCW